MRLWLNISIRRKITLIIMLTSSITLLLAGTAFVTWERISFRQEIVNDLTSVADIVASNSTAALSFGDQHAAAETLGSLADKSDIMAAGLYTTDGKLFAQYVRTNLPGAVPAVLPGAEEQNYFGADNVWLSRQARLRGEVIGRVYIQSDLSEMNRRLQQYTGIVALVMLVSVFVAFLISSLLQQAISNQILNLAEAARTVSLEKNYAVRVNSVERKDELGLLITWFNEMLDQIQARDKALQQRNDELGIEIAERQRAEQQLRDFTASLERSNRELQDFAYVASHDLQEPLRKVQAFGDRLKSKYGAVLDDTGRDYLTRMHNAASRMQTLINDLLIYSRVTTQARPFVPVSLARIAREVVADLEVRIEQSGGRVEIHDLPDLEADPTQMRQVLQNLIGNALKYHRPDLAPHVIVRSSRIEDDKTRRVWWRIEVEDNGIGFEEKYLDKIFGIFQRLHGRDGYEGTGVGLAVVKKIVERHGGDITARSQPDQGSTFIFNLPAPGTESAGQPLQAASASA